ncbi:MAG: ABC transporter substrate-binding protein [Bacteroidales bacterium]|nr:ABC transporter substrate-binding protein [Bacteroidales bacterium]
MTIKKVFTDDLKRKIEINYHPNRIISLVPSITELLFDLGLDKNIVGITDYCIHPKELVKEKTKIKGPANINFEIINKLNPDLIIANKEENIKSEVLKLSEKYKIWVSNVNSYNEALNLILSIGELTGTYEIAQNIKENIDKKFKNLKLPDRKLKIAYIIWKKPYLSINNETYIGSIIEKCGCVNIFGDKQERYPKIKVEEIINLFPDYIYLSSEPYSFIEKDVNEIKKLIPDVNVKIVDGEMFSWYGSRMLKATDYFEKLFNLIN